MTNVVALRAGGRPAAIIPDTIEEVFRLATAISKSGLAPNGVKTPEAITIAIMHGLELGLPPMQAVQKIAVVNGRPTLWGDAIPALLLSHGFKLREWMAGVGETRCAFCEVERPTGEKIERAFSKTDACTAGLWGKVGPWKQYPDRMLQMRARGFAARDGAADVLGGLYMREEIEDDAMRDVTPKSKPVALDLPDIPDEAPEPSSDQQAILRALERELTACTDAAAVADVERNYQSTLIAMDENGREEAIDMIQAAKG